jgi:DNA-binding response OmpR family regulator
VHRYNAVLLDQNLDHPTRGGALTKGTDLIPKLREAGFKGTIVMKSANNSSMDRALYLAAGADGVIDKGAPRAFFSR